MGLKSSQMIKLRIYLQLTIQSIHSPPYTVCSKSPSWLVPPSSAPRCAKALKLPFHPTSLSSPTIMMELKYRYSTLPGYFLQDDPATDPATFDYVSNPGTQALASPVEPGRDVLKTPISNAPNRSNRTSA